MSRLAWTDPAPLEVERPRLPWWTMLSRKLLLTLSPVILLIVVVMVLVFTARRVWRYPLFLTGGTIMAGLGVGYSWWAPVKLAAGLAVAAELWAWAPPDSFDRITARQVRSEWRRALVYAWPWRRVMLFWELTKRTGHRQRSTHYPTLRRVRADGWRDRVSVKLLHQFGRRGAGEHGAARDEAREVLDDAGPRTPAAPMITAASSARSMTATGQMTTSADDRRQTLPRIQVRNPRKGL